MAAMQKLAAPNASAGSNYGSGLAIVTVAGAAPEQFPAGLRVLVVDDDVTCLKILEHMLRKCRYHVITCSQAMIALSLLRERKGCFDVVISDVHMPDMDGFKLLELVGLEMDLPVIMMSADGRTSAVMRGIKHGACDYLIKPVRMEELKNVWQHVVRKKWNESKDIENSGSFEDSDRQGQVADESEYASSMNEGTDASWKTQKKKRDSKDEEDDVELDNEDPSASKKPRVVWSVELHQQFVNAVNQVGIDKAVPKRILELMNVPGARDQQLQELELVAAWAIVCSCKSCSLQLQELRFAVAEGFRELTGNLESCCEFERKFRLYLKRISSVTQHQAALPSLFCNQVEAKTKCGSLGSLDFHSLAASGQIPPQTLAALHAELLCHPSNNIVFPAVDQPALLQASSQGSKFLPLEKEVAFGQPLFKCQSGMQKQLPPSEITVHGMSPGFSSWSSNQLGVIGSNNKHAGLSNIQNNSLLMQMLQHQQQQEHHQESFHSMVSDSNNAINVQPSCLVVSSQSPSSITVGCNSGPINQKSLVLSPQPSSNIQLGNNSLLASSNSTSNSSNSRLNNPPLGMPPAANGDFKDIGMLSTYYPPSSLSSSSVCTSSAAGWRPQNNMKISSNNQRDGQLPKLCIQGSEQISGASVNQGQFRNLGFVGKGTCIPSRFAVDDLESPTNDKGFTKTSTFDDVDKVKQELNLDFLDGTKVGNAMLANFPSTDFLEFLSNLARFIFSSSLYGANMEIIIDSQMKMFQDQSKMSQIVDAGDFY
ncbi:hypothetical protein IEQ34_003046 [Dendrobium chrysotoxum]|uniref:Response regulatory domain-containing protein n=1 Tax=Dendrobium chrysotoxum TaxID=161865 RepID=A0AAV7HIW0_DENCH|nr:hypothetical protein IEQ34_003046 [Dendrobium chrysotoxum]